MIVVEEWSMVLYLQVTMVVRIVFIDSIVKCMCVVFACLAGATQWAFT